MAIPGKVLEITTDPHGVQMAKTNFGGIGKLAIHGAVNDLAMCGARPLDLSTAKAG